MNKTNAIEQLSNTATEELGEMLGVGILEDLKQEHKTSIPMKILVAFSLSDQLYGVEITEVQEVIKHADITRVPSVDKYVMGVMNLRGNITPVIDLYIRLSIPPTEIGSKSRIIVLDIEGQAVGFLVDHVSRIVSVADQAIEDITDLNVGTKAEYIDGIVKISDSDQEEHQGEILLKLNLKGVFSDSKRTQSIKNRSKDIVGI